MKLHFLGTGSSFPTVKRGTSSLALQHDDGCVWLFDCGEGTQIQLQKSEVTGQRITAIFITHLHGDHLFGLPGLLCTVSQQLAEEEAGKRVVDIYGPLGIQRFINTALMISCSPLVFKFRVHELVPIPQQYPENYDEWCMGVSESDNIATLPSQLPGIHVNPVEDAEGNYHWPLVDDARWCVRAGWIHHRVPTFGFVLAEKNWPGTLDLTKLAAVGLKPGPVCGELKAGRSVVTESGRTVMPEEVLGPPIPGRTIVILGDTSDATPLAHLTEKCDLLVHEATHDDGLSEKAAQFGHSTPTGAVAFAKKIGAKMLLLNHFSQRYSPADSEDGENSISILEAEAQQAASGSNVRVMCTRDMFVYNLPRKPRT